jgi:hypothetical protein
VFDLTFSSSWTGHSTTTLLLQLFIPIPFTISSSKETFTIRRLPDIPRANLDIYQWYSSKFYLLSTEALAISKVEVVDKP